MSKPLVLTWGKKHSLLVHDNGTKTLATLKLDKSPDPKPGAPAQETDENSPYKQRVPISLTPDVTRDVIETAWNAQGKNWVEIVLADGSPFLAVRVIWLPKGCIIWFVFHVQGVPVDACSYTTTLTKESWEATWVEKLLLKR